MDIDRGTEERSVWNFGNYLRTALFLLFVCAILPQSYDKTDLALLEGGINGPDDMYHNWIGFLGAHVARALFYTFGLATYCPLLVVMFLLLVRRFIPELPRRSSLWWVLPTVLLGGAMLFAMWPQEFVGETDALGIGRAEQSSMAMPGGVVGAALAAPKTPILPAGVIRRYIGNMGTFLVALAFLLPGLVFLFIHDWLPLIMNAIRGAAEERDGEGREKIRKVPKNSGSRIYTPENPDGEQWDPEKATAATAAAPEIHLYGEDDDHGGDDLEEEEIISPPSGKPSKFKSVLGSFKSRLGRPAAEVAVPDDDDDDEIVVAPPTRSSAAARRPGVAVQDRDEGIAPALRTPMPARPLPGSRSEGEELVTQPPRKQRKADAPPEPPPEPEEDVDGEDDIVEEPPVPKRPARTVPTHSYAANKAAYDKAHPAPAEPGEPEPPPPVYEEYHLPSPMLLDRHGDEINQEDKAYIQSATDKLEETLNSFHVGGIISDITVGPRVTQFEIALDPGVKVDKITGIQGNLAMALEAQSIRIRAPIPGKNAVGIEVPNKASSTVYLRPLLESATWRESHAAIPILLGRDIAGKVYMTDLAKAPHMLIAGSTGSGKSVCMNTLIMSLLFRFSPDELKLIMVDPKVVELEMYRPIPHLITPVVNDPKKVPLALRWGVNEMERRYMVLAKVKAKNLAAFNSRPPDPQPVLDDYGNVVPPKLPILIIIIDELADIMMTDAKSDVEQSICRIAQKGRAAGLHLVIATQSPRKEVVTGLIKANIPTKIAFRVSNGMDSRVILDAVGAEKLLGNGDMLFNPPGGANLERIQGAYVSDKEIAEVIDEVAAQRPQTFDEGIFAGADEEDEDEGPKGRRGKGGKNGRGGSRYDDYDDELDDYDEAADMANSDVVRAAADKYLEPTDPPIMLRALEIIINDQQVSTSYLQRRLGIGYNKAADIIDKLEQRHVISAPLPGGQKRSILITDGLETSND